MICMRRRGPIRHASYIGPIVRTALKRKWPKVSVEVDGQQVVDQRRGLAIVANFSGYAFGMDPARDAKPDDGLLDVVFLPTSSVTRTLLWAWRSRKGVAVDHPAAVVARGARVTLSGPEKMALQLDGDARDCRIGWTSRCFLRGTKRLCLRPPGRTTRRNPHQPHNPHRPNLPGPRTLEIFQPG